MRSTAVGTVTPSCDGNSSLTSDGTFTFGYDARGRRKTKTVITMTVH